MTGPRRWEELNWSAFRDNALAGGVAVLPVAAIEQHGPHLPLAVDAVIGRHLLELALQRAPPGLGLLALPMQSVGASEEHQAYPGTLSLESTTLVRVCADLGDSVHRAGVRRLVLLNSHGGNAAPLELVAQALRVRHRMLVVTASWSRLGLPPGLFPADEIAFGIHGGQVETSLMLHFRPELVDMALAQDFRSTAQAIAAEHDVLAVHGPVRIAWQTQDLNPAGACGNAAAATAEAGRLVAEHQVARFLRLVEEVAAYDLARLRQGPC